MCEDTQQSTAFRLLTQTLLQKYDTGDILTAYSLSLTGIGFFDALSEAASTGRVNRSDRPAMQIEVGLCKYPRP